MNQKKNHELKNYKHESPYISFTSKCIGLINGALVIHVIVHKSLKSEMAKFIFMDLKEATLIFQAFRVPSSDFIKPDDVGHGVIMTTQLHDPTAN